MSLPLSRRIAQAALLVAAGATPLIAAGSASAAELVPHGTDLGSGFSKLDGVTKTSTLQGETHQAGQALGTTAAVLGRTAVPAAADATGMMAATALPQTDKMVDELNHQDGSTTAASGLLTETAHKLVPLVGGSLPGGATRSMPAMPASPLSGTGALAAPGSLPGPPTVSGVDKVVNADTVSNPLGATRHLLGQVPATSSLSAAMPGQDRLAGALPSSEGLGSALPDSGHLLGAVPATQHLGEHGLPSAEHLTSGTPQAGDLVHPTEATDALHLAQLNGQAGESAHRLGGLPDLGSVPNLLGGLTGALQHTPSVS
ncbi:hypothetical protein [Kitasatospora sp. NBC_01302]|uniref:hypothetical protein n=1 Tax=Kitasatospora sp. NBC_01302 TaxID=2903575 RepID=UPI002E0FE25F|nr:hypothetical protein OG294_25110 [Kitasatospora sp. NBC_01302]